MKKQLENDLIAIVEKHKLTWASFCAQDGKEYIGILSISSKDVSMLEAMSGDMCVGGLWQHARNMTRAWLDTYEGNWK